MGDEAFAPDTEEAELDVQGGHSVSVRGERGKMARATRGPRFSDVTAARLNKRRLLPDLYEL